MLVLAGAGSGKTRVLTHRIAHLIADEHVDPSEILAITFTNKAAGEMRERLAHQLGGMAYGMWVSTFHAMCVRILRTHADKLGFTHNFTIYDDDDQKRLIKEIMKSEQIDEQSWSINAIRGRISSAKNELQSPAEYSALASTPPAQVTAQVYEVYQRRLFSANAMDFDDLLAHTVKLFVEHPTALHSYQKRFRYIHVDEYQDTNHAQYRITNMLAAYWRNLMVVGDDDQSIYSWRGADISNILEFEKDYPEAHVVKLEQNYRSTQTILDAANAIVANNLGRKDKRLFTEEGAGEKVALYLAANEKDEANYIAGEIEKLTGKGEYLYKECAVFYRTNAQSRNFEDAFLRAGIPYRLVGGTKFFERAEIRDVMAYLKAVVNPADDISIKRIINSPKRALGKTTVDHISQLAYDHDLTFDSALRLALEEGELRAATLKSLASFVNLLDEMRSMEGDLLDLVELIIDRCGLIAYFEMQRTDEAQTRVENIREFVSVVADYADSHEGDELTLESFMEWLALRSDLDSMSASDDSVTLMTVHTAKGLEYPVVFVGGLEENIFPHQNSIFSDGGIEEERRLMYVAVTRARKLLYLTYAASRMTFGSTGYNPPSRFIQEIPTELVKSSSVGSSGYSGFGYEKRGDRHGVSHHGTSYATPRYLGGDGYDSGFDPTRDKDLGRIYGAGGAPRKKQAPKETFAPGDRIDHKTFGRGTIVSVDGDSLEIAFDGIGKTKKLLVGYAPIVKIQ